MVDFINGVTQVALTLAVVFIICAVNFDVIMLIVDAVLSMFEWLKGKIKSRKEKK